MREAVFCLDDSENPGLAKVELIEMTGIGPTGQRLWKVQVLEIIKPSFRRVRKGQILVISERHLKIVQEVNHGSRAEDRGPDEG